MSEHSFNLCAGLDYHMFRAVDEYLADWPEDERKEMKTKLYAVIVDVARLKLQHDAARATGENS